MSKPRSSRRTGAPTYIPTFKKHQKKSANKKTRNNNSKRKDPKFTNVEFPYATGLVPYIPYTFRTRYKS